MQCFSIWSVWSSFLEGLGTTPEAAWMDTQYRCHREYITAEPPYEDSLQMWWEAAAAQCTLVRLEFWAPPDRAITTLRHLAGVGESKWEFWRETLDEVTTSQRHIGVWGSFRNGRLEGLGQTQEQAHQDAQSRRPSPQKRDGIHLHLPAHSARRCLWALAQGSRVTWREWRSTFEQLVPGDWCPTREP